MLSSSAKSEYSHHTSGGGTIGACEKSQRWKIPRQSSLPRHLLLLSLLGGLLGPLQNFTRTAAECICGCQRHWHRSSPLDALQQILVTCGYGAHTCLEEGIGIRWSFHTYNTFLFGRATSLDWESSQQVSRQREAADPPSNHKVWILDSVAAYGNLMAICNVLLVIMQA